MALKKKIKDEKGITCSYWNIGKLTIAKEEILIKMVGYLDEKNRKENEYNFPSHRIIGFRKDKVKIDFDKNIYKELYRLIKEFELFVDSEDC